MFVDNPDFFPTPRQIARRMLSKITNREAKYFLEPSAGKGDIADVIRNPCTLEESEAECAQSGDGNYDKHHWSHHERNVCIDVVENYPALIQVLRGKEYDVVGFDWLTYDGVSYYDVVAMNPPFSEGAKHLLKAWDFLHQGEVVCLLNEETIKNPYTQERQRLAEIIKQFGEVEYLGDCFSTAEHKTDVNIALVYLKKVAPDDAPDLWAKDTTHEKHYGVEYDGEEQMLAIRDNLGNMEHSFNMANEHWMKGIEHIRKAKLYMDQNKIHDYSGSSREEDLGKIVKLALSNVHTCRSEFLRRHRKLAWTSVFQQMEFNRWLDSKQQGRFLRDVERDSTIPFTAANIKSTLENVFMSRKKLFEESVANVFDELCGHAVENGSGPAMPNCLKHHWNRGEGWKTNDSYKVNQRLVFPHGCRYDSDFNSFRLEYGDADRIYSDLDRILCVLDGRPFDKCFTVGAALSRAFDRKHYSVSDQIAESEYFEICFYKKGTVHLKWKREDLWEAFNRTAAAGKKWLGENTQQYRPKKRREETEWSCAQKGHKFKEGECINCGDPEVDEVAAVECEYCRAIFEYTGQQHCPLHEYRADSLPPGTQLALSAPTTDGHVQT
jgi:hypothetical protein